jgi:hypothetical protein
MANRWLGKGLLLLTFLRFGSGAGRLQGTMTAATGYGGS